MQFLFVQTWDIIQGKEEEYTKYVLDTHTLAMELPGPRLVGAYYVEVGTGPRIVVISPTDDLSKLYGILTNREHLDDLLMLRSLVCNYSTSVLEPLGALKKKEHTVQKGVWKMNLFYNVNPGTPKERAEAIVEEHLTLLKGLKHAEVTGGWSVILGGTSEYIVEMTFKDPTDIGRLLKDDEFRKITNKMRTEYITNYSSNILRCTERFDDPKWFRL